MPFYMNNRYHHHLHILTSLLGMLLLCGCTHIDTPDTVPDTLYNRVGLSFLMITREDEAGDKTTWNCGSGFAVEENGRHYLYTARHVLFDKKSSNALPKKLYATTLEGESFVINLSKIEIPHAKHDAARIILSKPICRELQLAKRPPRYLEAIFAFGDARSVNVMCGEAGKIVALGPLEFEHTADTIMGMSGGPVVDSAGRVIGLCAKGRTTTARKDGIEIKNDSRYLQLRNFATPLHNIKWQDFRHP